MGYLCSGSYYRCGPLEIKHLLFHAKEKFFINYTDYKVKQNIDILSTQKMYHHINNDTSLESGQVFASGVDEQ